MPRTNVVFYRDDDGSVPLLEWIDRLPAKAKAKCRARIGRLRAEGHALRRPEADYLRDGVYELRVGFQGVNYRMLYFFHGATAAVLSHGLIKERVVPSSEIEAAIERRTKFVAHPAKHTHRER
ncbi:MAG: type II toxin-antitoxin system RelE/ParE family toxin [Planctomycetes bacterium]|nr:type II toxin-antitoxin system RelE/ParE family toxin [Planctomycetota bacterium]MBM4094091.1 type II toxin-antitoxin system RelE/ParE family toxin [Planctomycetota bacterium]